MANFVHHCFHFFSVLCMAEDNMKRRKKKNIDLILEAGMVKESTPPFLFPACASFFLFSFPLTGSLWISFLILHMQMIWGFVWIHCPPSSYFSFPWVEQGVGWRAESALRHLGLGVSLGKQRPGQQGFTQTLH